MKRKTIEIALTGLVALGLLGSGTMAVPYTYVEIGGCDHDTPHLSPSATPNSGYVAFGANSARVYDLSDGTVEDLGQPSAAKMYTKGITDDGYVAADGGGDGYAWIWDPNTTSWAQSPSLDDHAVDTNLTHMLINKQFDVYTMDYATQTRTYVGGTQPEPVQPNGINNNGDIVAYDQARRDGYIQIGGSWSALPLMPLVVNDSRLMAGWDTYDDRNGFVYDYDTGGGAPALVPIPFLPEMDSCLPADISNDGVVIGDMWNDTIYPDRMPFVWDAVHGTRSLNDPAVVSNLPGGGDFIVRATDINENGLIVGTTDGGYMYVLIPESVGPTPKNRGDVTEDLFVGADDLVRILTHWGESGPAVTWSDGDCAPYGDGITTGDQFVGADDYVEVLSMWGTSYPAEPTPTPEPATLGLLLLGGLALLLRNKRR